MYRWNRTKYAARERVSRKTLPATPTRKQDIETWVQKDTYERIIRIKVGQQDFHRSLTGSFRPCAYTTNLEQEHCDLPHVQEVAAANLVQDTHDNAVLPHIDTRKSVTIFRKLACKTALPCEAANRDPLRFPTCHI